MGGVSTGGVSMVSAGAPTGSVSMVSADVRSVCCISVVKSLLLAVELSCLRLFNGLDIIGVVSECKLSVVASVS